MRVRLTVLVTRPRVLAEMVLDRLGVRIPNFMDPMIEGTSHPVSRVLWPLRAGDHPSVNAITGILQPFGCAAYPDAQASSPRTRPRPRGLLGLAPSGVCRAVTVTDDAVGPYPAVSPSPARKPAVCFLWHCPAGHPGWALPTTLLCGARTFLDSSRLPRSPGWLVRRRFYGHCRIVATRATAQFSKRLLGARIRSHSSQRTTSSSAAAT